MFAAIAGNLKLGRGSFILRDFVAGALLDTGYEFRGDLDSFAMSVAVETVERRSNTQAARPITDQQVVQSDWSIVATLVEHTRSNLLNFFLAELSAANQTVATNSTKTFESVTPGLKYDLGKRQVTSVTAEADGSIELVADTDYTLSAGAGFISFVDGGAVLEGMDVVVTFSAPAVVIDRLAINRVTSFTSRLIFIPDDANAAGVTAASKLVIPKVKITPDGEYQLITENEYGGFNLNFLVLDDSANTPAFPFGYWDIPR